MKSRRRAELPLMSSGGDSEEMLPGIGKSSSKDGPGDIQNVGAVEGSDSASPYSFSVVVLLAAAFLNLLGFTMTGPISPALGRHFGLEIGASFGSLTSAYPLGMLFGLFFWPQLSDRIGRKPVIASSLLGSGIGLLAQVHAIRAGWGLRQFLAMRVLTGSFAGSSPVTKAYLADLGMANGRLPKYLAWRDAAATLSFIAGPALGGLFFEARRQALKTSSGADASGSLAFVIGLSSMASLVASVLVSLFVRELPKSKEMVPPQKGLASPSRDSSAAVPHEDSDEGFVSCPLGVTLWKGVASVCMISFLFNVGDSTFQTFFPAFMRDSMGLDTRAIGLAFTGFACVSFTVSAGLAGKIMRRFGPAWTCASGLAAVGTGLMGLAACSANYGSLIAVSSTIPSMAPIIAFSAAFLYFFGVPLYGPTIPTMLLRCVPTSKRGAVMGLDGAVNTIARVISPLAVGEIYRRKGATMAFSLASGAVLSAAVLTVLRRLLVMRDLGISRIKKKRTL